MRTIAILAGLIFFSLPAFAQGIKGHVYNESIEALEGISVSLHGIDGSVIKQASTNNEGGYFFHVENETNLSISLSHVSYNPETIDFILRKDTIFVTILKSQSIEIAEVTVTSRKKPIENKNGKIIANVQSLPGFQTETGFGILKKLPGITTDDSSNISLHGQAVQILIDGRELLGIDGVSFLKAIPSSSLDQIELISNKRASSDSSISASINIISHKRASVFGRLLIWKSISSRSATSTICIEKTRFYSAIFSPMNLL